MQRKTSNAPEADDPLPIVKRLLSMAELFRKQAKGVKCADEALSWEKKLRERAAELEAEAEPAAKAA